MFRINTLTMFDSKGKPYSYKFKSGINYFRGKNNSGKTEFYNLIDYMFGDSQDISNRVWYKGTLNEITMEFEYNDIYYLVKRTLEKDKNFFRYKDEEWCKRSLYSLAKA